MDEERQDFAAKLTMIEREAELVLEDLPAGALRDKVQNIATVARLLRLRLDVASNLILNAQNSEKEDFADKLALIEREAKVVLAQLPPSVARERMQHITRTAELLVHRL